MKIGLLGGGNISDTHARAARAIPGVEIAAIHGSNRDKAARLAQAPVDPDVIEPAPVFTLADLDGRHE